MGAGVGLCDLRWPVELAGRWPARVQEDFLLPAEQVVKARVFLARADCQVPGDVCTGDLSPGPGRAAREPVLRP